MSEIGNQVTVVTNDQGVPDRLLIDGEVISDNMFITSVASLFDYDMPPKVIIEFYGTLNKIVEAESVD